MNPAHPFGHIKPQSVEAIKGFTADQLKSAAATLGHRFVHIDLSGVAARAAGGVGGSHKRALKQEVLEAIGRALSFPAHYGANLDALYDCLTDLPNAERGLVVLLDRIPTGAGFDADARESLLETFRDAADFHVEAATPFRVFYSYA